MRLRISLVHRVSGRSQMQEGRENQRRVGGPSREVGGIREDRVGKSHGEHGVVITSDPTQTWQNGHIRGRHASGGPVGRIAQRSTRIALKRPVLDRKSPDPGTVNSRLLGRLDPPSPFIGKIPEVMSVTGDDIHIRSGFHEPADHRPTIILGAADARKVSVDEPGNLHRASSLAS